MIFFGPATLAWAPHLQATNCAGTGSFFGRAMTELQRSCANSGANQWWQKSYTTGCVNYKQLFLLVSSWNIWKHWQQLSIRCCLFCCRAKVVPLQNLFPGQQGPALQSWALDDLGLFSRCRMSRSFNIWILRTACFLRAFTGLISIAPWQSCYLCLYILMDKILLITWDGFDIKL